MADLGSLYFDILLRDKTAAERAKIKRELLNDLKLNLDLQVDTKALRDKIRTDLLSQQFKINVVVDKATATQAVQQALSQVRTWNGKYTADDLRAERGKTQQALQQWRAAQAELAKVKASHISAKDAANAHMSASISLGNAMGSNITIAGRLGSAMASLYSVHMIKDFLANVVEIGGELEHQKIAMDTIFGDKGKTIDLFDKIKGLARNSPFGVMELTKSVKALSAYGVEYNEIYDTAKRLADISAATSVDINRLILAFGKTKSRTFLDGLEAKQFAYANIPIYDMLSKKLTELEGKFVSVKEVMGRIKKREIGFDMVKEVLWDLTDEGGKFYNMQEALAGSVKTSWKLVKDNIELMYGELAESLAGPLKGTAEILQGLTRNWQTLAWVLGGAVAVLGVYRLSQLATNMAITKATSSTYQQIMAEKAKEAAELRALRVNQRLTQSELQLIATSKQLTVEDFKRAINSGKLTHNQIIQLGTAGKLNKEMLIAAVRHGDLSKAEAHSIANGRLLWMNMGKFGNRLKTLGYALADFGKSLWAFMINPWTIAMGALTGFMILWQRSSQEMEKAKEIGDNLFTKATEGAKNLAEKLKEIKPAEGLDNLALTQGIEQMELALKDYSPDPIHQINDALIDNNGHVRSLEERYNILRQKIIDLKDAYDNVEKGRLGETLRNAINTSGGSNWFTKMFNDDVNTNAKDYEKALADRQETIYGYMASHKNIIRQVVETAARGSEKYAAAIVNMTTYEQKFVELVKNRQKYQAWVASEIKNIMIDADDGNNDNVTGYWDDLRADMDKVWVYISNDAKAKGVKSLSAATDEIKQAYAVMIKNWIGGLEVSQEVKDQMYAYYSELLKFDFENYDAEGALMNAFSSQSTELLGEELAKKIANGIKLTPEEEDAVSNAMYEVYLKMFKSAPENQRKALSDAFTKADSKGVLHWVKGAAMRLVAKMEVTLDWPDWKREINKQFGGDPEINAWLKGSEDVQSFIEAAQKGYKAAKGTLDKLKPLALKAGLNLDFENMEEIVEGMPNPVWGKAGEYGRQLIHEYNVAVRSIKAATNAGKGLGFDPAAEYNKGNKSKKDTFLEQMKERLNLLKKAYDEYKKWVDLVGKKEALAKVRESGIFDALFSGKEIVNLDDYKGELDKLLSQMEKKANTKERREFVVNLKAMLNLDMPRDEVKEKMEGLKDQLEAEIKEISKQWNLYNQIVNAGGSKLEASQTAFGRDVAPFAKESRALASAIQKRLKGEGFEMPFSMTIEEATKILGETDNPFHKALLKAWTEAKEAMEKDEIDIKIREVTAINKFKPIAEKIKDLNEKYSEYTGLSVGENGELMAQDGMTPGQEALFREYQEKLAELRGELLTLLPVWEQIFGDHTYQSYGQLNVAADVARQIVDNAQVQKNADGKPTVYTSSYKDATGKTVNVSGQFSQLEKLKKAIDDLYKAALNKNPFSTLIHNISEVFKGSKGEMKDKSTMEKIAMIGESAADSAKMVGTFAGQMSEMFDALGDDDTAEAMNTVGQAMNSVANIGQAFAQGGLIGGITAVASEALGWITTIFKAHDENLQEQIENSQRAVKKMQNIYDAIERKLEYHLGSGKTLKLIDYEEDEQKLKDIEAAIANIKAKGAIDAFDVIALTLYSQEVEKLRARVKAFQEGGAYGYQRQILSEQLAELEKQREAELNKKKKDQEVIDDYDVQIDEMRDQIRQFAEEVAENLYGINIKEWASQLGDAIYEAWQRGEDGAEAFKNTVADIMGDVMNSILKLSILEPAMADLQKMLFGDNGASGMFGKDFELDDRELEEIGDYLMGLSDKSDNYIEMLDKLEAYMMSKYGVSMKDNDGDSGTLSKGIQSVTETTADLLASYINAIRADVSMKKEYVRMLVEDLFPRYSLIAEAQLRQLEQIANNTGRNATAAEEILSILNSNTNPGNGFKIS